MEGKFILHGCVHARSRSVSIAFKYASGWFCVEMCGLLEGKNFLPGFLVFTEADSKKGSSMDLNSRAYFNESEALQDGTE